MYTYYIYIHIHIYICATQIILLSWKLLYTKVLLSQLPGTLQTSPRIAQLARQIPPPRLILDIPAVVHFMIMGMFDIKGWGLLNMWGPEYYFWFRDTGFSVWGSSWVCYLGFRV